MVFLDDVPAGRRAYIGCWSAQCSSALTQLGSSDRRLQDGSTPPGSGRHSVGETNLAVVMRCSGVEINPAAGERRDVWETGVATGAAIAGQRSTRETGATRAQMSRRRSRSRPFLEEKLKDVLTIHESHWILFER